MAYLLLFTLFYRLFFWWLMPRAMDSADAIHYLNMAQQFASGDFGHFDTNLPVLYSLLTALVSLAVSDLELAATLVSLVVSTLLVLPVYGLSRSIHGPGPARIAALIVAIMPWLVDYATRVGPDALGCLCWFLALYWFAHGIREGGWRLPASVLAVFALHLSRPEGFFYFPGVLLGALILYPWRWQSGEDPILPGFRKRWFTFLACSGGLMVAYALYMRSVTGDVVISYRAHAEGDLVDYFWRNRIPMLRALQKLSFEELPVMLGPLLLPFAGAGMFMAEPRKRTVRIELFILYFCLMQWALTLVVCSPSPRYVMGPIVAACLWSARGMALVSRASAGVPRFGRWLRVLPVLAVVCLMLQGAFSSVVVEWMGYRPNEPREYKTAGRWMKENLAPGTILTRKPQVGYYSGMPTTGPALTDSVADAVQRARDVSAKYLVVDERYTASMAPGLVPLLDPANASPQDLRLLQLVVPPYPNARVAIYEVLPKS
jgi:4-amino-4-deoxy-L-arabinose transferase-like glycosyltransferase